MKKSLLNLLILANFLIISALFYNHSVNAGWFDFAYLKPLDIKVTGNSFFANNVLLRMRGVAMGDPHSRRTEYDRDSFADYQVLSSDWKANVVRISVHPGVWRRDKERGKKILEEEIEAARRNGLAVIVDWHVIGEPNGWYKQMELGPSHSYTYESSMATARDFWHYMAMRYSGDKGVIFEIWNEPARADVTWKRLRPYMQELVDGIRGRGANNVIIAPGAWWAYDMRGIKENPLKGNNIAYAWHNYPENSRKYISWDKALANLNAIYPVVVTEWGYTDQVNNQYSTTQAEYIEPLKRYMYDKKLGFTAWCWHPRWKPTMLNEDWRTPNAFGATVKNYMNDLAKGQFKTAKPVTVVAKKQGPEPMNQVTKDFINKGIDYKTRMMGKVRRLDLVTEYYKVNSRFPKNAAEIEQMLNKYSKK
jgi:aryl-phospho-beta-D-glucosidase BglC (GH1 family)